MSAHEKIQVFLWVAFLLISINISSILLYKSLNSQKEYLKYIFSLTNVIIGIIIWWIIWEKILQMAFLIK